MIDRRDIVRALRGDYPETQVMTSEELEGWLNAETGLSIGPLVSNGLAFDAWLQALAKKGKPHLFPYGEDQIAALKARGEAMRANPEEIKARLAAWKAETEKLLPKKSDEQ